MSSLTSKALIVAPLSTQQYEDEIPYSHQIKQCLSAFLDKVVHLLVVSRLSLVTVILAVLPLSSHAAISATTSKSIQGTAPYFVLNGTALNTTDDLLGFYYKDAEGNTQFVDGSSKNTTIIVSPTMKIDELVALVDIDGMDHSLNNIVQTAGAKITIEDNDGDATVGHISANGSLRATLKRNDTIVQPTNGTLSLDPCEGVYTLEIASTADNGMMYLQSRTTYGAPNYREYSANTVLYTLAIQQPYICYAQPNLAYKMPRDTSTDEWDIAKGFIPLSTESHQTTNNNMLNFPTTGFNYAYFNLTLAGATAQQVIKSTADSRGEVRVPNSEVYLQLEPDTTRENVLKVILRGPSYTSPAKDAHKKTTFDLRVGNNSVYSFVISKWFIAIPDTYNNVEHLSELQELCAAYGGDTGHFRVPSPTDFTNAIINFETLTSNTGYRAVGGGLFKEWGRVWETYYLGSDFVKDFYFTDDDGFFPLSYNDGYGIWLANSNFGNLSLQQFISNSRNTQRLACVSP